MSVIHLDARRDPLVRELIYSVACGPTVYAARASTDPHDVTCRRCKATVAYKRRTTQIPDPPSGATGVGSEDPPPLTHPVAATKDASAAGDTAPRR